MCHSLLDIQTNGLTQNGQIFARKELNFERMSERDRKQIVAEVSVLPFPLVANYQTVATETSLKTSITTIL